MGPPRSAGWDPRFVQRSEWLWPLARAAAGLQHCSDWPELAQLDALYATLAAACAGAPLRFVPDVRAPRHGGPRRAEDRYDAKIALGGAVPTRARNWHDLLNALCFATWPRSKRTLHARQLAAFERRPDGLPAGERTPEQDALTLFDEGGVAIAALAAEANDLQAALAAGDLAELVRCERAGRACIAPFGHALLEHLVADKPCPGASARVIALAALPGEPELLLDLLDVELARELARADRFLAPREAAHLRLAALEPHPPGAGARSLAC